MYSVNRKENEYTCKLRRRMVIFTWHCVGENAVWLCSTVMAKKDDTLTVVKWLQYPSHLFCPWLYVPAFFSPSRSRYHFVLRVGCTLYRFNGRVRPVRFLSKTPRRTASSASPLKSLLKHDVAASVLEVQKKKKRRSFLSRRCRR